MISKLTKLFFFTSILFSISIFSQSKLRLVKVKGLISKEYKGYKAKLFEDLNEEISIYVDYNEEYRPQNLELEKSNFTISGKNYNAYKVSVNFSVNAKKNVAGYGPNMQLLFKPTKEEDYNLYFIKNGTLTLAKELKSSEIKQGRITLDPTLSLMQDGAAGKKVEKPIFAIIPLNEVDVVEKTFLPKEVTLVEIDVKGSPFDTDFKEQVLPASHENIYGSPPHIISLFGDGFGHICWEDVKEKSLNITLVNSNLEVQNTILIKSPMPKFGGCTMDEKGNYFVIFAKDNKDGDFSSNIKLVKYDKTGKELGSFEPSIDRKGFDVMTPISAATSKLSYGNGKIAIHMGKTQHKNVRDGLNHQSAIFIVVDSETMKQDEKLSSTWMASHSFDQRIIFDGTDFLTLDLADNFPRGFAFRKSGSKSSRVIFTYKTKHKPDGKTSNDNRTYSELGGIVSTKSSYAVLGASEKSFTNDNANDNLNDSRNLFLLLVAKDFDTKKNPLKDGKAQNNLVSKEVVISKGEDSGEIGFYDFGGGFNHQQRRGVIWLTNYNDKEKENAARPKIVYLDENKILVLWESWSSSSFNSTKYMIVNSTGKIIKKETDLGSIRLGRADEPILVDGKVIWVTGKESKQKLKIISFSP